MEISIYVNKYVVYIKYTHIKPYLVDGFNPFEKYARQIGSSSQVGGKNKKCSKPPPRYIKKPYNNLCIVLVHSLLLGVLGPALQLHPLHPEKLTVTASQEQLASSWPVPFTWKFWTKMTLVSFREKPFNAFGPQNHWKLKVLGPHDGIMGCNI